MTKLYSTLLLFFFVFSHAATAQKKARIAVIGSSTSYGQFGGLFPRDSGYVPKLETYYRDLGLIDTIDNYGMSSKDCYEGMPTGYVPPTGRRNPDPSNNITKAVNATPKPDVVIVNYPSNSYEFLSDAEIIFCLDSIKKYANERGVKCYITTSQPRDDWWSYENTPNKLCRLKDIRDLILNYFGEWAIDFYTDVAGEDCKRKPEYALQDDFYHLNPAGHTVLRDKVIERNILFGVVALHFVTFQARQKDDAVNLSWKINADEQLNYFRVMRSTDGQRFHEVGRVAASTADTYFFEDRQVSGNNFYYRVEAVMASGHSYYSKAISVDISSRTLNISKVTAVGNSLAIEIKNTPESKLRITMVNMNGQRVLNEEVLSNSAVIRKDISSLPAGVYAVIISSGGETATFRVVKN